MVRVDVEAAVADSPEAERREFDLGPANDPALFPPAGTSYPPSRRILLGLALGLAGAAAVILALGVKTDALLRWWPFEYLDAAVIPVGLGLAIFFGRPVPPRPRAQHLEITSEGFSVRFSDGRTEHVRWDDPDLDAGIGEGSGLARAPDRVIVGLWGAGWRTPALITPAAREAILRGAVQHGLRQEIMKEDVGSTVRTTVYLHPRGP